jgi:hypothetical protein
MTNPSSNRPPDTTGEPPARVTSSTARRAAGDLPLQEPRPPATATGALSQADGHP